MLTLRLEGGAFGMKGDTFRFAEFWPTDWLIARLTDPLTDEVNNQTISYLIPLSTVLENLTVPHLVKKFLHVMETNDTFTLPTRHLLISSLISIELVHAIPSYFKICFNIILPSTQVVFFFSITQQHPACICILHNACHTPYPSYPLCFDHSNNIQLQPVLIDVVECVQIFAPTGT